ncbi:MAG: MarR family transcriptional regulator [Microbacterium sp.]|nr:MarR family transcriptional regulator [Microbacterium sp.]
MSGPVEFTIALNRFVRYATAHLDEPQAISRALSLLDEHPALRVSEFAALDRSSQPAATELLKRLEADGLVSRAPDPRDGRAVLVALTPAGSARLAALRTSIADRLSPTFSALSDADVAALDRTVRLLAEATTRDAVASVPSNTVPSNTVPSTTGSKEPQ